MTPWDYLAALANVAIVLLAGYTIYTWRRPFNLHLNVAMALINGIMATNMLAQGRYGFGTAYTAIVLFNMWVINVHYLDPRR